jgi:DNA-binding beta-propeller fold protein YncE
MRAVVGALLAVWGAGCAGAPVRTTAEILWPGPPLPARIKFVGFLRHEQDVLGRAEAEGSPRVVALLLGRRDTPSVLRQPMGLAVSHDGARLYVTDFAKPGVVVFDLQRHTLQWLNVGPNGLQAPFGIALDAQEQIYVADSTSRLIYVLNAAGVLQRTITHESLVRPTGLAVDAARHRLYVADSSTRDVHSHAIRLFDLEGHYQGVFGEATEEGLFPTYLTVDAHGNVYATDTFNARVRVFDPEGRLLQTVGERGDAYGMFDKPKGVALDAFGNVYVVDSAWSNVQIFNPQGQVLLFFGGRGQAPGLLSNPTGLAIDGQNRIYVADAFNSRISIYQLMNTTAHESAVMGSSPAPGTSEQQS